MRLIDADALMKEFAEFVKESNNSDFADVPTWNDAVSLVGSAPIIEPEAIDTEACACCPKNTIEPERKICKTCKYQPAEKKWPCVDCDMREPADRWEPEQKKGKWIYGENEEGHDGYFCNKCGGFVPWIYKEFDMDFIKEFNFCPNCGADMRGEQE